MRQRDDALTERLRDTEEFPLGRREASRELIACFHRNLAELLVVLRAIPLGMPVDTMLRHEARAQCVTSRGDSPGITWLTMLVDRFTAYEELWGPMAERVIEAEMHTFLSSIISRLNDPALVEQCRSLGEDHMRAVAQRHGVTLDQLLQLAIDGSDRLLSFNFVDGQGFRSTLYHRVVRFIRTQYDFDLFHVLGELSTYMHLVRQSITGPYKRFNLSNSPLDSLGPTGSSPMMPVLPDAISAHLVLLQ